MGRDCNSTELCLLPLLAPNGSVARHAKGPMSQLDQAVVTLVDTASNDNLERVKGIEPSYAAWEAAVLPLNYTRISQPVDLFGLYRLSP